MNEIKQYKPIALVFYIDWNWERNALPLDDSKREAFKKAIENSKMVELEWITINTFDIKEIRPAQATTEIEKFFFSQDWTHRVGITERTRRLSGNPKVNVVEYFTSWGDTPKAIHRMESMIEAINETLSDLQN